jgi:transcriptional regulator with PAS, ATPase and Fis domain
VEQFVERFSRLQHKAIHGIEPEALSALVAHNWPGNVRELENVIERAFVLCLEGPIRLEHLPEELRAHPEWAEPHQVGRLAHDQLDAEAIRRALEHHGYNRLAAAKALGIHKTTLFRRIKKLGISLPGQDGRTKGSQ